MSFLINPYAFAAPIVYDPDAADYISRVETADGQALETSVKAAMNTLVVTLKSGSIWTNALQYILQCGPRTLAGALVPLTGPSPTNINFVAGDYNRKTGLGDPANTSKWLDSNVAQNSLPAASHAVAVYGDFTGNSGDIAICGWYNDVTNNPGSLLVLDEWANYVNGRAFRSGTVTPGRFPVSTATTAASCMIGSREAANSATLYVDGVSTTNTTTIATAFSTVTMSWFGLRLQSTGVAGGFTRSPMQAGGFFSSGLSAAQAAAFRSAAAAYVSAIAAALP
jgi:hypothetical protein